MSPLFFNYKQMLNIIKATGLLQSISYLNVLPEQASTEKVQWQLRGEVDLAREPRKEEEKETKKAGNKADEAKKTKKKNRKDDDDDRGGGLLEPII